MTINQILEKRKCPTSLAAMNPKTTQTNTTAVSGSVFRQRKSPYSEAHKKKPQAATKPPLGNRHPHPTQLSLPRKMCFNTAIPYKANGITQTIKKKKRRYLRGNVTFWEKGCKPNTIYRLQEAVPKWAVK